MIAKKELENKLNALKINGTLIKTVDRPFFVDYIINFDGSITINRILARQKDIDFIFDSKTEILFNNGLTTIRTPKKNRCNVDLWQFKKPITESKNPLPLAIGQTDEGHKLIYDLCKLPHLLVGGSTGSGKSVFINNCILSLIWSNNCDLILIDPKRVEFSIYDGLPCVYPIIYDVNIASDVLKRLCLDMENRYKIIADSGCRNISEYNQLPHVKQLRYKAIIIDELADIMIKNRKIIESYIIRIAQLGRACGFHMILATQRPSTDIITGLIKSNIPSRICFSVASTMDSRIIIDSKGGENLIGNGDGIFNPITGDRIRIQSPFAPTEDIKNYIDQVKNTGYL